MVGQGGVERAREFCRDEGILGRISKRQSFAVELDRLTDELAGGLPTRKLTGGSLWGPARKVLNIVLSDAAISYRLREKHRLADVEDLLGIPLDSYSAEGIHRDCKRLGLTYRLGRWPGVVRIICELNAQYQVAASEVATPLAACRT